MAAQDQQPIGSGFGRHSTAAEVLAGIDLTAKTFIVTGGYSGIGLETVRALANAGAAVTVPARSRAKAEAELAGIARVTIADMDLADLASVRRFAADFAATGAPLHGLINNAGVMACPLQRIGDGWEYQFAVCHLGHFELARRLRASLAKANGARVVALSSTAHIRSDVHWDDPHFNTHAYDKWDAYGQAKTADSLFALGVDARWRGDGIRAFAVHPGGIFTPLQRHLGDDEMVALGWKLPDGSTPPQVAALFKTPEAGAATSVWCAVSPQLAAMGGLYCEDCDIAQLGTAASPRWAHVREWAVDPAKAERLWGMSEAMIDGAGH